MSDLGEIWYCLRHGRQALFCPFGVEHEVIPVRLVDASTASEVASACPTEVLIEVLVERGVLTIDHNVKWDDLGLVVEARFVSEWNPAEPVAGGVS